ncbi:transglutaminase-like domain-containing protein [Paenibacillus silvae]|uniref:Transglutaminase n=1 Tax=Paenibacillus silvae TaxID=1325358 RepID=A0A2W6NAA9_9BACL|nr:transglutaminase-like domain-containing protein [Paenibacillus silvae]MCK6073317.1 transglutaminase-like domain-containing protein [Paenibacillus silvae]MCK6149207.1 transglutaminase-like domain-containing protein [Paenibacillus silvae]MCK6267506.1 transglutaminase-like domain-containing protein [Paenibacillus silvae]PZT52887.1 transglutaminase [Paenibacillus silvae]
MNNDLEPTELLNFNHSSIQDLILRRQWASLPVKEQILHVYNYVRDEIEFGYNRRDDIPASQVLQDGYGQCNTKGILFMALLRALGIPCRIHGFTIDKQLQKGAMTGWYYHLSPKEIIHSWIEVLYNDKWLNIEGFIVDLPYLTKLQQKFNECTGSFCGYGVATDDFQNPAIFWDENDTYVQKEGIVQDFGTFDHPDQFFTLHPQKLSPIKRRIFSCLVRHLMNRNVRRIRKG